MNQKRYYKVVCLEGFEMAGAGLGYEEIYGSEPRYFWDLKDAQERAKELNDMRENHNAAGHYEIEFRTFYPDGSWDDEDDRFAAEQLGLVAR